MTESTMERNKYFLYVVDLLWPALACSVNGVLALYNQRSTLPHSYPSRSRHKSTIRGLCNQVMNSYGRKEVLNSTDL